MTCDCDSVTSIVEMSGQLVVHILSLDVQISVLDVSIGLARLSPYVGQRPLVPVHLVVVLTYGIASPRRLENLLIK